MLEIYFVHDKKTQQFLEESTNITWSSTPHSTDFIVFITCVVIVQVYLRNFVSYGKTRFFLNNIWKNGEKWFLCQPLNQGFFVYWY